MQNEKLYFSGTSGLVLPVKKSEYPPEFQDKTMLQYYSTLLNTLEINSSFYKLPKITTIRKWSESVPENFRFTFKVSKSITHSKQLDFSKNEVFNFMEIVNQIGDKKACLLLQFPPSVAIDKLAKVEELLQTFATVNNTGLWKIAVEFRNLSWYQSQVYKMIDKLKTTIVLHDMRGLESNFITQDTSFYYLRFHGPDPRYRGDYSANYLVQQSEVIKKYLAQKKIVYVYFNNTMGAAFSNLETLNNLIRGH